MAHPPEIRHKLRAAYVYDRLPLESAAEKCGIGYATARRWKAEAESDGDDWERGRSAARLAGDGMAHVVQMMLDDYLILHQSAIDGMKSDQTITPMIKAETLSRLADAFTKTMSAIGKVSPELSRLAVATDVLQRLAKFVTIFHPHMSESFLEILEPFAGELAKEYN